jgi:bacterioferritin-associated ferredoxin
MVLDAIRAGARTVRELSDRIGAGDGCMACHARLEEYLAVSVRGRLELVEA